MFCPDCGEQTPEGRRYCVHCGADIAEALTPPPHKDSSGGFKSPFAATPGATIGSQPTMVGTPESEEQFAPGAIVDQRYEVRERLGHGGMGAVYLVHDRDLGDDFALKVMHPEMLASDKAGKRFVQEARLSLKLSHRNIVRVHHLGQAEGRRYLTMELLQGRSLRVWLRELEAEGRLPDPALTASIVGQVLDALEYAHRLTVHRDVKPENIFLVGEEPDLQVKLLDFGIAKALDRESLTTTTQSLGTAVYLSPEQLEGTRPADGRSDLYATGVVLYELITGQLPVGSFPRPSELRPEYGPQWDAIILSSLSKDPAVRPESAAAMAEQVRAAASGAGAPPEAPDAPPTHAAAPEPPPTTAPEPPPTTAPEPPPATAAETPPTATRTGSRRKPWIIAISAVAAFLLVVLGWLYLGGADVVEDLFGDDSIDPEILRMMEEGRQEHAADDGGGEGSQQVAGADDLDRPPYAARQGTEQLGPPPTAGKGGDEIATQVIVVDPDGQAGDLELPPELLKQMADEGWGQDQEAGKDAPAYDDKAAAEQMDRLIGDVAGALDRFEESLEMFDLPAARGSLDELRGLGAPPDMLQDLELRLRRQEAVVVGRRGFAEAMEKGDLERAEVMLLSLEELGVDPAVLDTYAQQLYENYEPHGGDMLSLVVADAQFDLSWVPEGQARIGSPGGEACRDDDEDTWTAHTSTGFWMGTTEVTQEQWRAVMGNNPSKFSGCDPCPVERVSWYEVQEFLNRLNALADGPVFRLPTEAEWEYAARAGSAEPFGVDCARFGPGACEQPLACLEEIGWYAENAGGRTHPVAEKSPNAWGLFDMAGNVWEWCEDSYESYPRGAQTDYVHQGKGEYHVLRGGSWFNTARSLRLAERNRSRPDFSVHFAGFRVVLLEVDGEPW